MRINLLTENTISIKTSMTENNIDVSIVRSMFLQLYLAEEERHSRQKSYYQNLVMQPPQLRPKQKSSK